MVAIRGLAVGTGQSARKCRQQIAARRSAGVDTEPPPALGGEKGNDIGSVGRQGRQLMLVSPVVLGVNAGAVGVSGNTLSPVIGGLFGVDDAVEWGADQSRWIAERCRSKEWPDLGEVYGHT